MADKSRKPGRLIPYGECRLLSRANARRYVGDIGEEKFMNLVRPHLTPRRVGTREYWDRKELDAWVDWLRQAAEKPRMTKQDWLDLVKADDGRGRRRRPESS